MGRSEDQADKRPLSVRVRHAVRVIAVIPVWLYRKIVSPGLPPSCIYAPTCSAYMLEAILKHGAPGALAGLLRILRCVGGLYTGGEDPVPERITAGYLFGSFRRFWRGGKR
jgi:uncharacterized protein